MIDEPHRAALAYGTLTGHPVSGEEAFLVDRHADDTIWLTVRSLTQFPAGFRRLAYPGLRLATRAVQGAALPLPRLDLSGWLALPLGWWCGG